MANRTPVLLDAWSGQATPLHHFKRGKTDMVIPMTLGGNETSIVAFVKDHGAKDPYVTDFTGSVKGFFSSAKKSKDAIFALVSDGAGTVTLSNGKECRFKRSVPKTTALNLWNIIIESWERPNTTEVSPAKLRNITFLNQPLVPWLDLDGEGMDKVSGVGYYSTNFTLPSHYPKSGLSAYLHLGRFEGAVRLWLNGK